MSEKVRNFTWCQSPSCAVCSAHRSQLGKPTGRRGLMVDKDGSTDGDRRQLECSG